MITVDVREKNFIAFDDDGADKKQMISPVKFSDRRIETGAWKINNKFGEFVSSGWTCTIDEEGNINCSASGNALDGGRTILLYSLTKEGVESVILKTPHEEKCLRRKNLTPGIFEGRIIFSDSLVLEMETVHAVVDPMRRLLNKYALTFIKEVDWDWFHQKIDECGRLLERGDVVDDFTVIATNSVSWALLEKKVGDHSRSMWTVDTVPQYVELHICDAIRRADTE